MCIQLDITKKQNVAKEWFTPVLQNKSNYKNPINQYPNPIS
jgi:hypothetical protein